MSQLYTISQESMYPPSSWKPVETYTLIYCWDNSNVAISSTVINLLQEGTTAVTNSTTGAQVKLFTLSASANPNTKYAFEGAIYNNTTNWQTNAALYDFTGNGNVAGSIISTTATSPTVVRSGQFTLTPGRTYGVSLYNANSGSQTAVISDAYLITFP